MKVIKRIIPIAAIVLLALPFLRAWDYGIVNLDDYIYLTGNPLVTSWHGLETIRHVLADVGFGIWMPLTWLSYTADFALFGDWFGGFHIHSILIHCVNAALLFVLLSEIHSRLENRDATDGFWPCLFATLIWAVHPLRCESVVFLSSRKDVLSFMWELLALICWIRGGNFRTAASLVFFALGAMCKPSVMTFPALCLLIDVFVKREIRVLRYLPAIAFAAFLAIFAGWQQKMGNTTVDAFNQPLWGRLLGACAAFGIYLRNTLWPQWLAPQCIKTWPMLPRFWLPGLVISGLWGWWLFKSIAARWSRRKDEATVETFDGFPVRLTFRFAQDPLLAGGAWFALALVPMLGIVSFGFHAFADRFTYIPSVGLSVIAMIGIGRLARRLGRLPTLVACSLAVLALGWTTGRQTGYWADDEKLFTRTLEVDGPRNTFAHWALANQAFEFNHDLEKCVLQYELTLALDPAFALKSWEVYVIALCELGRIDEAADAVKLMDRLLERCYGRDLAYEILKGESDLPPQLRYLRTVHNWSRFALWLHMPDSNGLADKLSQMACKDDLENMPVWIYLRMRLAEKQGDAAEASRLRALLKSGQFKDGYLQFRFLRR